MMSTQRNAKKKKEDEGATYSRRSKRNQPAVHLSQPMPNTRTSLQPPSGMLDSVGAKSQMIPQIIHPSPTISGRGGRISTYLSKSAQIGVPTSLNLSEISKDTDAPQLDINNCQEDHHQEIEIIECPICTLDVGDEQRGMFCERCLTWYHGNCLLISEEEYELLSHSQESWFCYHCRSIKANKLKWGSYEGEEAISNAISQAYEKIVNWKRNFFSLPRGKSGTDFIKEVTRLINLFVNKTKWERLSIPMVHIFIPLMIQKPSKKSKAKDHAKYLASRLEKWSKGELKELISECFEIQTRITKSKARKIESKHKAFCRLMFQGKVGQACKYITNDSSVTGVHIMDKVIKKALHDKHPRAEDADNDALLQITTPEPENVIFEQLSAEIVQTCCRKLSGSGGPTLVDSDLWKYFVCSRAYGNHSYNLAEAISGLAKRLCTEKIHPDCLKEFIACRLIPLDKGPDKFGNPGIRPIGIGEILRRIVGKSVTTILKNDIQVGGGCIQTCTGLRSGIEASIHAASEMWHDPSTEAILQVDAENAFNRLNRKVALHNIREVCPPIHRFLQNHYQIAAKLMVSKSSSQNENIFSEEGCTQGDPAAMAFYALGVKPLVDRLSSCIDKECCQQSWYADDSSAIGKMKEILRWWQILCLFGPKYGYFPKASKTILIIKDKTLQHKAESLFSGTGIEITTSGKRHLGAVIGNENCTNLYVETKVKKWIEDVEDLSRVCVEEPQVALSAYTKAICHRWSFIQRTIPNISAKFQPLEDCIRSVFIPSIIGRHISDTERCVLSLPVRYGGLGIANPVETADREYHASKAVTRQLTDLIKRQDHDISHYSHEETLEATKNVIKDKECFLMEKYTAVISKMGNTQVKRCLELNREKGAGSWLTALPLQDHDFCLNKQEFRDALCLRYGWKIPHTPSFCACGAKNTIDHTLVCMKGGFVSLRHNALRDLNAELQREVCKDVVVEPQLLPLEQDLEISGTSANRAAPDISSRGLWSTFQRTFFDVRVLHPNAPSYLQSSSTSLYNNHEKEKMRKYSARVMSVEKGSFTPLVYTTFGGWGPQATAYHKKLATLIAKKRNEDYHRVISHIRVRVRFALLRSVLVAVRGERGRSQRHAQPLSSVSFNMVPEASNYESP